MMLKESDLHMNLLVTGGLGFIGSNFIRLLLESRPDIRVINLDKITYAGNPANLKDVEKNPQYCLERGDICDYERVDALFKKHAITHVVNFAAESHVDRSIANPDVFIETNIKGTLTLLNAAKHNQIQKFVQISTDEVYGSLSFEDPAFTETTPISPRSPYAASKASADLLALAYFHTYNFPVSITRCSNNYGPYQFPEKLIPLMVRNIRLGQKLPVYGDGKNVRDWIHVKDHCEGILSVLDKGLPGEVYNFGGNAEKANIDLVHLLLKELNASESLITYVKDRPGHDLRYAMNFDKAKRDLGWSPKITFEDGLKQTVQWYLDNSAWVDDITSGQYLEYYKQHYGNI